MLVSDKKMSISEFNMDNSYKLFDREMVLVRSISDSDILGGLSRFSSFKVFYDPFQNISYIKLNRENERYYDIKKYILSLGLQIKDIHGEEVVELGDWKKEEMNFLKEISSVPGVMRYPFSLMMEKNQYFRFLTLEESLESITKIIMDFLDKHENWDLLYLREPESIESFLRRYQYEKSVKFYKLLEKLNLNPDEYFPHYKCEHLFFLLLGEPNTDTERSIRFTNCETGAGGIIRETKKIRDSDIKIYEDIREINEISFVNIIKNPYYSYPLEIIQHYDGKNVYMRILIDKDDEKIFFIRLRDYNKKLENKVKFILEETTELY